MRSVAAGWRVFRCDECGAHWESTSRDHASPSGEDCDCGEWVSPHASRADETLVVNEYGNLSKNCKRVFSYGVSMDKSHTKDATDAT